MAKLAVHATQFGRMPTKDIIIAANNIENKITANAAS
jgi:hypothetical protein